jgi:hypothetical protein
LVKFILLAYGVEKISDIYDSLDQEKSVPNLGDMLSGKVDKDEKQGIDFDPTQLARLLGNK